MQPLARRAAMAVFFSCLVCSLHRPSTISSAARTAAFDNGAPSPGAWPLGIASAWPRTHSSKPNSVMQGVRFNGAQGSNKGNSQVAAGLGLLVVFRFCVRFGVWGLGLLFLCFKLKGFTPTNAG